MNTAKAILLGMSLIAGAIIISYANASATSSGNKYVLSSSDGVAYRMNTVTGEVSICIRGMTMEEALGCSPWSR